MAQEPRPAQVYRDDLRGETKAKYTEGASEPEKGFHFEDALADVVISNDVVNLTQAVGQIDAILAEDPALPSAS